LEYKQLLCNVTVQQDTVFGYCVLRLIRLILLDFSASLQSSGMVTLHLLKGTGYYMYCVEEVESDVLENELRASFLLVKILSITSAFLTHFSYYSKECEFFE
jgi:hypothetical protein